MGQVKTAFGSLAEEVVLADREGVVRDYEQCVSIVDPRLPFGEISVESLTPIFQVDPIYGINAAETAVTTGNWAGGAVSSSAAAADNLFTVATGATVSAFASLQSRKRLRYRPGQGLVARYTALFSAPVAGSILLAGVGTSESSLGFGYNGTSFGILHSTGGAREIRTLTVTTASTATNNYQVTLNDVAFTVSGATNNGSTTLTAYQIAQGTFTGWQAYPVGATVVFVRSSAGPVDGAYTIAQSGAGTPVAGTYARTKTGVATTDTWIPQASWNGSDKLDGAGASGVTLDPTKGNVYQLGIQYLGFGALTFGVEICPDDNKPRFQVVHTIAAPNTRTTPTLTQPSLPFLMSAYSVTSTTNVSVSVGSFAGFVAGQKINTGPRLGYVGTATSSTSVFTPLFTVRNNYSYGSRANQAVVNLLSVSGAAKSNTGLTTFYLIKNATLSAVPAFANYAASSCTSVDTAATVCTFATNDQLIWSDGVAESGNFVFAFTDDVTLQPGETVTFAVKSVSATAVCIGGLNTREDQ
jgi:hypothetical protein